MARYDLLLQGGMIYDPCAGVLETGDIAVKDGVIAARGKALAADAETVMDVHDCSLYHIIHSLFHAAIIHGYLQSFNGF